MRMWDLQLAQEKMEDQGAELGPETSGSTAKARENRTNLSHKLNTETMFT